MSKVLKWLDNFWYHHKWTVIVVTFFVSLAVVLGVQLASRENYDAYIMYGGDASIPDTKYHDIQASLKKAMQDYNEDGEVLVNFSRTAFISDKENEMASTVNASAVQFLSSMQVQPYYLYFMSSAVYELYKDQHVFIPIAELGIEVPAEWCHDAKSIDFAKTDYAKYHAGFDALGEDVILVIKGIPFSYSDSTTEKEQENFENHRDILKTMLEYRK